MKDLSKLIVCVAVIISASVLCGMGKISESVVVMVISSITGYVFGIKSSKNEVNK
jgi:hypothetical protein